MDELIRLFTLLRLEVSHQFTVRSGMMMDLLKLEELQGNEDIEDFDFGVEAPEAMEVSHWIFNVMMALNDAWNECPDSVVAKLNKVLNYENPN